MDVLMVFAWIVFITMIVAILAVLGFLAALPGRVARQREHPYADAIAIAGYYTIPIVAQVLGLVTEIEARYNLEAATARAPADGYVTNIALRPGSRVVAAPLAPAMTFLDTNELLISNAK